MNFNNHHRPLEQYSIEQLVSLVVGGRSEALAELYMVFYSRLCRYGHQVLGANHSDLIHDVVQELFIWISKNNSKLNEIHDFEVYLFQAIRQNLINKSMSMSSSQKIHNRYLIRTHGITDSHNASPEKILIGREDKTNQKLMIEKELNNLPHYLKETIYLRYFERKEYKEISQILCITEQVARNYIARGIKRLRRPFMENILIFKN